MFIDQANFWITIHLPKVCLTNFYLAVFSSSAQCSQMLHAAQMGLGVSDVRRVYVILGELIRRFSNYFSSIMHLL